MNDLPPAWSSATFNSAAFQSNDSLSKSVADRLYLPIGAASALSGVIPGLATASKAVVLDASRNITNMGNIASTGTLSLSSVSGGDVITMTTSSTSARNTIRMITDTQSWEMGTRGSTAANPNTFYMYNGSYKLVMQPSGDTALNARLSLNTSGSHLGLVNGASNGLIEQVSSSDLLRLVRGYAVNIGTSGINIGNGSVAAARYPIDLGATAADVHICTFQSPGTSIYGIGANNTASLYTSGGSGGHRFYYSTGPTIGSLLGTITTDGNMIAEKNVIGNTGGFFKGFNGTGLSGTGVKCHMGNATYGEVFAYDYTASAMKNLRVGNRIYISDSAQSVAIGSGTTVGQYPLSVLGNFSTSFGGSYGYLGLGGAGTGTGTGVVPVSIYSENRVWASEFNAFSDRRLKDGISDISTEEAMDFVRDVSPVSFSWKCDESKRRSIGYIAQDVLRSSKFPELVSLGPDEDLEEEVDEDGFVSPAGQRFVVSYQSAIPILHKAMQELLNRIEVLEAGVSGVSKPKKSKRAIKL